MNKLKFGKSGEKSAEKYLKKKGYKIIEKNYTTELGEIDIIARDNETTVFVEVKTRANTIYGLPKEAVNFKKQKKYSMVAIQYILKNGLQNTSCRFDVVEVLGEHLIEINHIINAFDYIRN